jgi:hypothetical protein
LVPRLSIGTLQLSIRCSSIFCLNVLFRSAPWKSGLFWAPWQYVTVLARWLVTARRLRAKPLHRGHVCVRKDAWSSPSLEADRAGWLKKLRKALRFLLPASGKPSCLISCSHASFDAKHVELAFDVAEGGPGHLTSRNPWTEHGPLPKAIARRLAGRRTVSTGWILIRTRPAGSR